MDAYCDRQGKSLSSLRFLYDGDRIQSHNTPADVCVYQLFLYGILK